MRARDPDAIRKARAARVESHFQALKASAAPWVPEVRRLRPMMPWEDVLRVVNSGMSHGTRPWTQVRLIRAAKTFVREGLLPEAILGRAAIAARDDRLPAIVAATRGTDPAATLQAICDRLEAMRERTPRGRATWWPSSVAMLLERAARLRLIDGRALRRTD